jgi:hypothetical protein
VKGQGGPLAEALRPVLDTYLDSAVAVVGCHAAGIQRESCEVDVVVVTNEIRAPATLKVGDSYFEVYFLSDREALRPLDPEMAVALAGSKPVRDANLILSTSVAANQAVLLVNTKRSAQARLATCLKALGRSDEAIEGGNLGVANYWLLSGSFDFAFSWLYSQDVLPSPSHLLWQLRQHSKGSTRGFESFAEGAGLAKASRKTCSARLEGLSLLYDLVGTHQEDALGARPPAMELSFQIVKRKADQLADSMEHAESYSYLGLDVVRLMLTVSRTRAGGKEATERDVIENLMSEKRQGLLGDRLLADLGMRRPKSEVEQATKSMRQQVSRLARRI